MNNAMPAGQPRPQPSAPLSVVHTRKISPSQLLGLVLKELKKSKLTDYSTQRVTELMVRFTSYVEKGHGIGSVAEIAPEHVEGFVFATVWARPGRRRPSVATMHIRRSALRLYFRIARQLGVMESDPTLDLVLPPRSTQAVRPLTDDEVAVCRSFSLSTLIETRRPAAWALAEATARTTEIGHVRVRDVDLATGRVWIAGGTKRDGRWGELTEWGAAQIARHIAHVKKEGDDDTPLVLSAGGTEQSGWAWSCNAITQTLAAAGLEAEPDVRPTSVAAWAGRRIFDATGRIDEVARRCGMRSLDRAAAFIGWGWGETADGVTGKTAS